MFCLYCSHIMNLGIHEEYSHASYQLSNPELHSWYFILSLVNYHHRQREIDMVFQEKYEKEFCFANYLRYIFFPENN